MEGAGEKLLFVVNPIAGGKNKVNVEEAIRSFCTSNNILYLIYRTTGKDDLSALEKLVAEKKPDAVVAVGGDGTVHLAGTLVLGKNIPLGIVPAGSANGLAKDLGIPESFLEALENIRNFRVREIDTLKVNEKNSFHIFDFGFNARVCHRFAESIVRGKLGYAWQALKEFFGYGSFRYKIEANDHTYQGRAFMLTVTNANTFGSNVEINPLGTIDDGLFEINILKPFPKLWSPMIMYMLTHSSIHKSMFYKMIRCSEAKITNLDKEYFHIDGEPMTTKGREIFVNIFRKGLRIILPG